MKTLTLNGKWLCKPDKDNKGIDFKWYLSQNFIRNDPELMEINIPSSFNTLKGYEVFEGIFWHFKKFDFDDEEYSKQDKKLRFNAANYNTKVWLNGVFLGEHDGGFTPFHFNLKKSLKDKDNFLVVRCDNIRKKSRLPAFSFDWFNYGGIYRDVDIISLTKNRIKNVIIKTNLVSRNKSIISISYEILGRLALEWEIRDVNNGNLYYRGEISESTGKSSFSLTTKNLKFWSPSNPKLYKLMIYSRTKNEKNLLFDSNFGIREIEILGNYIYLNKKLIRLKGASLHEELVPFGRTIPYEEREKDITAMKALGFNALRTAHYSHDEDLLDIADRLGILILEEIPVYWMCDYKSNDVFKVAAKMLRNLIKRDINHPSVIWWSVGNEIPIERPEVSKFMKRLMKWVRMHDNTRIVTYVSMKLFSDLTRRHADVACINYYFGWYVGSPRLISLMLDVMRTPAFNKPWIYTEFGAGAKVGTRKKWEDQTKYSEERQLHVLDYSIRTFNAKDYLAGWFIWIYRDFRSLTRQNEYQTGFNRKGIVSEKNEPKLINHRIPQILHKKRELVNTKVLGIILWILLYPIAYIITYLIIDVAFIFSEKKTIEDGKKIERRRRSKES
ncbi:MAG: hypothetical protein GF317_01070 [Candidatus Lokiarchaeota archaeon]|nr:hypothetical protein [Candidatus Lokiarchaeota archaeon]MBD3198550.1 hypothetical protein [Candidatus Lokiarchaeota archaeon]